jgi:hypothetical protein
VKLQIELDEASGLALADAIAARLRDAPEPAPTAPGLVSGKDAISLGQECRALLRAERSGRAGVLQDGQARDVQAPS